MELRQLQHFLAVLETGSFHGAANKTSLTQQAISRSIKSLEAELGVTLLERKARTRHKVVATASGRFLIPRAQVMLAEVTAFQNEIKDYLGTGRNIVRVGATPAEARGLVPQVISAFARAHPETRVQVIVNQGTKVLEDVAAGVHDLAICSEPRGGMDHIYKAEKLIGNENIFVARKGHPLEGKKKLKLEDLVAYEWVSAGLFEHTFHEFIRIFNEAQMKHPFHALETTSPDLAFQRLKDNDYIALMPSLLARDDFVSGSLCRLKVSQHVSNTWSSMMVSRAHSPLNQMTAAFRDTARDVAQHFDSERST